ncbi:MAG: selenocysteine-specific translation elongation factor [Verrucomicrobiia bacterium]
MNASSPQPAPVSHFILATAGHVDHGKSALVKALTGTDPDRLPEEKARGITIDLGFARLDLPGHGAHPGGIHLGIVDVPGHGDFISNMVAGVGAIDLALLVVAADDGWMAQTEEHLQILTYLGVTRAVVALSKSDLASDLAPIIESVRAQLLDTPLASAPIVPTSALLGTGIAELKSGLCQVLDRAPPPGDFGKPRLAIDRAFNLRGMGPVVTGTLVGGSFQRGQTVVLQPSGQRTRIRTIQSHSQDLDAIGPGQRTALGLADVTIAGKGGRSAQITTAVRRGDVVTLPELGPGSSILDVLVTRSARPNRLTGRPEYPRLKTSSYVRIHHSTCKVTARLLFAADNEVPPGRSAIARLLLQSPLFAFAGDRFIVRDCAERMTLAGGIVLDPLPSRRGFRGPRQQTFLQRQSAGLAHAARTLETWAHRDLMLPRSSLLFRTQFSAPQVADAVAQLERAGRVVVCGEMVVDAAWWETLRQRVVEAVDAHHQAHPEQPGLPLVELRTILARQLPQRNFLDSLLPDLLPPDIVRVGTLVKRVGHGPALPPRLEHAVVRLRDALSTQPLDPPSRKTLETSFQAAEALRFMLATGQVVEIGPKVVLLAEPYDQAVALIKAHLAETGAASVSELRQRIGSSRRVMVPLLEKLDREGVTLREGDLRKLRPTAFLPDITGI